MDDGTRTNQPTEAGVAAVSKPSGNARGRKKKIKRRNQYSDPSGAGSGGGTATAASVTPVPTSRAAPPSLAKKRDWHDETTADSHPPKKRGRPRKGEGKEVTNSSGGGNGGGVSTRRSVPDQSSRLHHDLRITRSMETCASKQLPESLHCDKCKASRFGNTRQNVGGSTSALPTMSWITGDNKSTLAEEANYAAVGNNKNASEDYKPTGAFSEYKKKFPQSC